MKALLQARPLDRLAKQLSLASLVLAAFTAPLGAASAANSTIDDRPLVDFLTDFVYQLEQPVYVYNWFNASGRDPVWAQKFNADESSGYEHYLSMAPKYWNSFCSKNSANNPPDCPADAYQTSMQFGQGNMFGPGLYAAVDPVTTSSYGGDPKSWVLMQMHLPKGMRMLDLRRDGAMAIPLRLQKVLAGFSCPAQWDDVQNAMNDMLSANNTYLTGQQTFNYSSGGSLSLNDQCLLELRKIFKNDLKLDAIYYQYNSTNFAECALPVDPANQNSSSNQNPFRQGAFVITSSTLLKASDIRVFNKQSTDDIADRARITAMFYKADIDSPDSAYQTYFQGMSFPGYPNYVYNSVTSNCSWNNGVSTCQKQIYICPPSGGTCVTVVPPSWPGSQGMPATISAAHPPNSNGMQSNTWVNGVSTPAAKSLLWPDLDGQPMPTDVSSFIKTDLFGCQLTREYEAADQ